MTYTDEELIKIADSLKEEWLDKACEVLAKIHKNYSTNTLGTEYLINDFKKAMEK